MTPNEQTSSTAPTHIAYQVREGRDKGFWTRIGIAWQHKDGKGFNVKLECLPIDGRLTLRHAVDKMDQ
ncbi:MAG: hypothetical protein QM754_07885 [Tepidisphaeraceae bacterium]